MMDKDRVRPTINMDLIKNPNPKMDEAYLTDPSSNYLSAKRRKSKIYSNRKTNEQLIKESHQDLLRYIQGVDHKVHHIIQSQEAQFLVAYKKHIKKVREEMEEIRAQSLNNSYSEKAYIDKIDCLEKELIIFRDESLKLFDKIILKDKEIFDLNIKIKELTANNQHYEKNAYFLTRRNKELEAIIAKIQQRYGETTVANQFGLAKREVRSENKRYEISTPNSQDLLNPHKNSEDLRPFTSSKTSNSFVLRINSNKKQDKSFDINKIKQKLQEKVGSKLVNIDTVIKIIDEKPDSGISKDFSVNNSPMNHRLYSKQKRRTTYRIIQDEVARIKSQEFAEKNQYLNIFKSCVQDVKRDIMKRNNIPSLNYFKENGPQNFIEFKKMDRYTILQMLLSNQSLLKKIYEIIFQ